MRRIITVIAVLGTLAVAGVAAAAPGGADVISQDSCEPAWFGTVCTTVHATTNMTATPSGNFVYVTNGTAERRLTFSSGDSFTWASDIHLVTLQKDGETQTTSQRSTQTHLVPLGHLRPRLRRRALAPLRERLDPVRGLLVRVHDPLTPRHGRSGEGEFALPLSAWF